MNKISAFVACVLVVIALCLSPVLAQEKRGGVCREAGKDFPCPTYRAWREYGFYEYREYDPNQYSVAAVVVAPAGGRGGIPHRALAFAFEHLVNYARGNNSANATVALEFPTSVEWFTYNHTLEVYVTELWLSGTTAPPAPVDPRLGILRTTADSTYFVQSFSHGSLPSDEEILRAARAFQYELIIRDDVFISNIHTVNFYDRFDATGAWTKEIAYYAIPLHPDGDEVPQTPSRKIFQNRSPEEWIKMAVAHA
jgi:hypothetical protein